MAQYTPKTWTTGETITATELNAIEQAAGAAAVKVDADAAYDAKGAATAAQAAAVQRANHTGTQSADTITDGTTNKAYTAAEKTKLAGVATGATANVVGAAGSGASNALSANDPTTTNSRTPTAHTHPASDLTATGTRDATTFLRGDNTWATPAGGGGGTGLPATILTKTTTYTAAVGDFVQADATSAGFTVTLPAAPATGALVAVKKTDAGTNVVTVVPASTGTIDGDPNATIITKGAGAIFEHVGSNAWQVTAVTSAQGPQGATGATGATGPAGSNGTAATVTVGTTNTLAAGASATVTNTGTTSAAVLNFGIPQGAAGSGGAALETTTAPPSTNTTGSVLGTASTAAHADHTHAIGAHDHTTTAKGGQIPVGGLSATGTASATTYLRGDGSWSTPAGGGGSVTVQDEGSALTARSTINFVGAGVTATDDAANSRTVVTIPGGGGSGGVAASPYLMPTGAVAVSADRMSATFSNTSVTSGSRLLTAVVLNAGDVISTVNLRTNGYANVTHSWVGLCDASRVILAVSADDTTATVVSGVKSWSLSSPYTVPTTGLYYVMLCIVLSAGSPSVFCVTGSGPISSLPPVTNGTADGGQTTPPTVGGTCSTITGQGAAPYFWLT